MKFNGKALLEKYGWEKGQGLGKEGQGMKEAIKVKIKPNTNGLGYSLGEQYTYNWWDHAYNQAAKNLTVTTSQDGSVRIETPANATDISVKKKRRKSASTGNSEKTKYNYFIQTATLAEEVTVFNGGDDGGGGGEDADSSADDDNDDGTISKLSTEELFEACGRMTAHKGARHGLNLKGKLTRVEAQEKLFLEQYKSKKETNLNNERNLDNNSINENSGIYLKIEKTKSKKGKSNDERKIDEKQNSSEENTHIVEKIKKKKKRKPVEEKQEKENNDCVENNVEQQIKCSDPDDIFSDGGMQTGTKKKKKKKSCNHQVIETKSDTINDKPLNNNNIDGNKAKKKKKKLGKE